MATRRRDREARELKNWGSLLCSSGGAEREREGVKRWDGFSVAEA